MTRYAGQISRVHRTRAAARATYDALSRWYSLIAETGEKKHRTTGLRGLNTRPGERVLEIGPGPGQGMVALAKSAGDSGRVYGLDLSPGMLRVSQGRLAKTGLSDRTALVCADGVAPPFRAASFDAILMSFTLELFDTPEIPVILAACQRLLRPEGRICVVSLSKEGGAGLALQLYEWAHRQLPALVDCRPILVQQALAEAGFQITEAEVSSMWGLPVEIVQARR